MRVLITGVTGFVGHHLAERCIASQARVVGLGRRPEMAADLPAQTEGYLSADLLDSEETEQAVISARPDRVFHLAADASVAGSWQDPANIMASNVRSTLNLLEAVRRHAPDARVLYTGSGEEYGPPESLPIDERQLLRPQNPYAVSKAAGDLTAGFYADAYGLHVIRTRAFNHAGPGQSPAYVISSFANQIAEAELDGAASVDVVTGNLEARRDFTDVRDIAHAYWMALGSCEPGIYNVASGEATSIQSILDGLAVRSEIEVNQRIDPKLLRPNEVPEIAGSSRRLREASGWEPEIALQQTLSDTLEWSRANPIGTTKTGADS